MNAFMHLDPHPDLAAELNALGVWVQTDVWSTHVLVLRVDCGDRYAVEMYDAPQEAKGQRADDASIEDALSWGADDVETYSSLREAMQTVAGGYRIHFPAEDPHGLQALFEAAEQRENLDNMSKYARKAYLRENGA